MKKVVPSSARPPITEENRFRVQSFEGASVSENPHATPVSQTVNRYKSMSDRFISIHANEIRDWSEVVFGKKEAMDRRIEKIIEDPSAGHKVLKEISLHPQSIHSLAGFSICGVENKARKNAMRSLASLHGAVRNLMLYSRVLHGEVVTEMGSMFGKPVRGAECAETPLTLYESAKETSALDRGIMGVLKKDATFQAQEKLLQYWCMKTFGRPDALNKEIFDVIRDPHKLPELLYNLDKNPEIYGSPAASSTCVPKRRGLKLDGGDTELVKQSVALYCAAVQHAKERFWAEHTQQQEDADMSCYQILEAAAQDVKRAKVEHRPTPQQERPRRAESEKMALAM
ncbi:BID domain-containing T4SS effector [Bartonella taylorii]|uniref:BID domain-containing T4SS effector n=1 Tax=Bartonella taylorii TaxID=33046 RepID=UPI001ABA8FB3|nr:BID domain-containing T4SS effector [Bartonella taylorii]